METFAGHTLPIVYKNQSIKSEHVQTRTRASAFDVSHMMQTIVRGKDRHKYLESLTVADLEGMDVNKCTLSVFTNEAGGIIDDCIISKLREHVCIVSNAANAEIVWKWLNSKLTSGIDVKLERLIGRGLIALQGPAAAQVLQPKVEIDLSEIEFMNTIDTNIENIGLCQITRCGYTGEDGFEISVMPDRAEDLMNMICDHDLVQPAGLGARDTLRLEAGLCLHGHDITVNTTPIEASLNWTVAKRRRIEGGFLGSNVIIDQLKHSPIKKRVGLIACSAGPPAREGSAISDPDTNVGVGATTSGNFSPTLGKNIAMAYLPTSIATDFGKKLDCHVRGKKYEYAITRMPFVKSNYYFKSK